MTRRAALVLQSAGSAVLFGGLTLNWHLEAERLGLPSAVRLALVALGALCALVAASIAAAEALR